MKTKVNIDNAMKDSFLLYAEEVAINRAICDVRDGLKLGMRQGLYAQYSNKLTHGNKFQKAQKSVAAAMSQSYVHGDAAMYGTFIRAAKPWAYRYPLEEAQGSYGSPCAPNDESAPRYVEMRASALSDYFFKGLNKNAIDRWYLNYDDSEQIPSVFPAYFWNVVNGSSGIAVGFGSHIPPFNLNEVYNSLIKIINNPNVKFEDIVCYPDFPTGCDVINKSEIYDSLERGEGKAAKMRAHLEYDTKTNCIKATHIPYGVYTNTIMGELADLTEDNPDYGIEKVVDHTKKDADIRIYLTKSANPNAMMRKLYKDTSLEYFYGINMVMLDEGRYPKVFSWRDACDAYIKHIRICKTREYEFDLDKALNREEILEGLMVCIVNIEDIVEIIKSSNSSKDASKALIENYNFTEKQADAILNLKLNRLVNMEGIKIEKELDEVKASIEKIKSILNDQTLLDAELIKILEEIKDKFGDERRSILIDKVDSDDPAEFVEPDDVVVMLTRGGYIKRVPSNTFRVQRRNAAGARTENAAILDSIATNTIDTLMIFTRSGKMFKVLVDDIPEGDNRTKGVHISNIIDIGMDEPVAITSYNRNNFVKYVVFITKMGMVKKTALEEFTSVKKTKGVVAIKLKSGDSIRNVMFLNDEHLLLVSKKGKAIRFTTEDITPIGRNTSGVAGIKLVDDEVVCGVPINSSTIHIGVFTTKGYGKKVNVVEFPCQGRNGRGVNIGKLSEKTGDIAGVVEIGEDNVLLISKQNNLCISPADVPILHRDSVGNIMTKNEINKVIVL